MLKELIRGVDSPIYRNASGNPIEISDGFDAAPVKNLSVNLAFIQAGSGDPSHDNIRPITGFDSVNITRTGENGANPQSVTVSFPNVGTVYGGNLNLTTGLLTLTHKGVTFNGTENWGIDATTATDDPNRLKGRYKLENAFPGIKGDTSYDYIFQGVTNKYKPITASNTWDRVTGVSTHGLTENCLIFDSEFPLRTDINNFKASLAEIPLTVVYLLATPVTYQLTPTEITTLLGYNQITSDAGEIHLTYRADPNLSI